MTRRTRYKSAAHTILVFTGLGLVTSILLAWLLALTASENTPTGFAVAPTVFPFFPSEPQTRFGLLKTGLFYDTCTFEPAHDQLPIAAQAAAAVFLSVPGLTIPGMTALRADELPPWAPRHLDYFSAGIVAGFPVRCFSMGLTQASPTATATYIDGVAVPASWPFSGRMLPLRILWPGLLIDAAVFAVLWFAPLWMFRCVRAADRCERAHCPDCNYDLSTLTEQGCPECGWHREPGRPQ